jgi:hypothetical protein
MPRYFLDYHDGANDLIDVEGRVLDNDAQATLAARSMLAERVPFGILRGGEAVLRVRVRRGSTPLFAVTVTTSEDIFRLDA